MKQYLTPEQALDWLPYKNIETVYRKIRTSKLKAKKLGRYWLIRDKDLWKFIERG